MSKPLPFAVRLLFATALLSVSTVVLTHLSMPRTDDGRTRVAAMSDEIIKQIGSE